MFNIITGGNESKTLTKQISCDVNVNLIVGNAIQIKSRIIINVDEKTCMWKRFYFKSSYM